MNLQQLIEICDPLHVVKPESDQTFTELTMDSRKVNEGSVFIAIRGTQVDGHLFIEDAIKNGAAAIICEETFYTERKDLAILEVENTTKLVGKVAQAFAGFPAKKLKIIGITGTNGKTTTATLVYQVLQYCGKKASLLGTVNKHILNEVVDSRLTTADSIELASDMKKMVEAGSEFLVMEVSSHALHQHRVGGINFTAAAFTNLSHDHLDYHHTIEDYFKAKKLLFDQLSEQASAIVNIDDPYGASILTDCKATKWLLSFQNKTASILKNDADGLVISIRGERIKSPLIGTFNAYNVGEAFLICYTLGLSSADIAEALNHAKGAPGRLEPVSISPDNLPKVFVDYAHTPDALQNVLHTLDAAKNEDQKLIVVFGAGGDRDRSKRPRMAEVAEEYADSIIVTSDNPRTENPDLIIAEILDGFEHTQHVKSITNRREAIGYAIETALDNDIVLIAGKGHETYQEINGERFPFDDREIAKHFLQFKKLGAI